MASNGPAAGGSSGSPQARTARQRLVEASRRVLIAQMAISARGVPVGVPENEAVPPWDRTDIGAVLEIHAAWGELIDARRAYDQLVRSHRR